VVAIIPAPSVVLSYREDQYICRFLIPNIMDKAYPNTTNTWSATEKKYTILNDLPLRPSFVLSEAQLLSI
jgi:hypothetical protein